MLTLLAVVDQAAEAIKVTEPAWKEFLNYGILGLMLLLFVVKTGWEIWYGRKDRLAEKEALKQERSADRAARHSLAAALEDNTTATRSMATHIKDLVRWVSAVIGEPPPRHQEPDTPPAFQKPRTRGPEAR